MILIESQDDENG